MNDGGLVSGAPEAQEGSAAVVEHRVVFTPSGRSLRVADGTTVLEAARAGGVDLDSVCGGRGKCGRCQVQLSVGEFTKWAIDSKATSLSPPGATEQSYRGARPLAADARLGCTAQLLGDAVVDVPAASQLNGPVVRKTLDGLFKADTSAGALQLDPLTTLHTVSLPEPHLDDRTGLAERVVEALEHEWQLVVGGVEPAALLTLQQAATAAHKHHDGLLTVAVRTHSAGDHTASIDATRREVVAAWPGVQVDAFGVAIDVGSTTIAGHLFNLATGELLASSGQMNPQIRLGEDLMSRVAYVMMNPDGASELTMLVRTALAELIEQLLADASLAGQLQAEATAATANAADGPLDPTALLEIVIVGNPVMVHLLAGLDSTPLGQAPFTLATSAPIELPAPQLDLPYRYARVYIGPAVAGHIGADSVAATLAIAPHRSDGSHLLVDVGTNAEIVLAADGELFAASSPTGPAFEGAQISCGVRAAPGAIERVRIDPVTRLPRVRVVGCEHFSDEPAFAAATRRTGVTGICGSGIIELVAEMYLAGVIDAAGTITPAPGTQAHPGPAHLAPAGAVIADDRTFTYVLHVNPQGAPGGAITVTQNDVRAIQLAKAALRAGVELLLEKAGLTTVDRVTLTGAFGAHINPLHAMVLGMVGDGPIGSVTSAPNAAGAGAARGLLSAADRREMQRISRTAMKIETATEPDFQRLFVDAMAIPHATAASHHLAAAVTLPEAVAPTSATPRRRRRSTSRT